MNRKSADLLGVLSRMGGGRGTPRAQGTDVGRAVPTKVAQPAQGRPPAGGTGGASGLGFGRRLSLALQGHVVMPVAGLVAAGIVASGLLYCVYQLGVRMGAPSDFEKNEAGSIAGALQVKRPQTMQDEDQRKDPPREERPAKNSPEKNTSEKGGSAASPPPANAGANTGEGAAPKEQPRERRGFMIVTYDDTPKDRALAIRFKQHLTANGIETVFLVESKGKLYVFVPAAGDSEQELKALSARLKALPPPPFDKKFSYEGIAERKVKL